MGMSLSYSFLASILVLKTKRDSRDEYLPNLNIHNSGTRAIIYFNSLRFFAHSSIVDFNYLNFTSLI